MGRPKVTDAQIDRMTELREAGRSIPWIARRLDLKAGTVDYHLRRLGVFPPGRKPPVPRRSSGGYWRHGAEVRYFTPAEDAALLALRLDGQSLSGIARQLGRKPNCVRARLVALANRDQLAETA
jgi:DNA-binding NarL/FixJ family response regulator